MLQTKMPQDAQKNLLIELKERLAKIGHEPDMIFTVLQGFCFGGYVFQGAHRIQEDKLRKNVSRRVNLEDPTIAKRFEEAYAALKNEGAISILNKLLSAPESIRP